LISWKTISNHYHIVEVSNLSFYLGKIAGLVRRSHEARKKSKELLEEAKRKVEEMIGKDTN